MSDINNANFAVPSGSSLGAPVKLTTADYTLIHSVPGTGNRLDEVYVWCANPTGASIDCYVRFGTGTVEKIIEIPPKGEYLVVQGVRLKTGSTTPVYVKAQNCVITANINILQQD